MISRVLLGCCLAFVFSVNLFAQTSPSCEITKKLGGKFKFVSSDKNIVEGRDIFFLTIKLPPEKFTKDYLLKVARRIRETYCNENVIYVQLRDSSDKRVFDDLTPPPIFSPWTKALYSLDRVTGKEIIQFIANDKVTSEIKISQ